MEDHKADAGRMLTDYYSDFSTLDVQRFLSYFHEPAFLMSPQGVSVVQTQAELSAVFTPAIESLRQRGYARSELSNLRLKRLSATIILASGVAVRHRVDGQELDRVGVTYLLRKADNRWKIAALVIHDTDNDLQVEPN